MSERVNILVVGSINMDLMVRTPHMPAPGETVHGEGFVTTPGGKGANQAVAAARLGTAVTMIGRVGEDAFGRELLANLKAEGVACEAVLPTPEVATGVAVIVVDAAGENSIVIAGGANRLVTPDDVFSQEALFERADAAVLQLETPLPTVRAAIDLARRHRCRTVLDPAPAPKRLPEELCRVDVLSPNVGEAEQLTGNRAGDERANKTIATDLIALGARAAVLKLGPRGSLVVTADGNIARAPAYKVDVTDTTGAGDAFTAALAVAAARGQPLADASRYANAAGALACTKLGAQAALPTADEVRILMADQEA